jgi:hypothetical protein
LFTAFRAATFFFLAANLSSDVVTNSKEKKNNNNNEDQTQLHLLDKHRVPSGPRRISIAYENFHASVIRDT